MFILYLYVLARIDLLFTSPAAVLTKSEKSTDAQPHLQSRYHLAQAMSSIIADGPDSQDVRQEAHPAANPERAHWYPMEDSFVRMYLLMLPTSGVESVGV